jgi:NAD(P)-dependent dehydrogenase (short-subunit alcohol dehydrogenase family)
MNSLFSLENKIAVITGGTGALGAAMCRGLAAAGATIVIMARTASATEALAKEIGAAGGKATGIACDVLDRAALDAAVRSVEGAHGSVDILVNAAGGNKPEATAMPGQRSFFDLPPDALQWVVNLNLMGTLLASQAFGASFAPLTRVVGYAAAKAGVNNFTQWLAVYMAHQHSPNIRVNAIAPGFFLGDQNRFLLIDGATGELTPRGRQIIDHTPMARFGEPDDLVGTLLWLASDASRFVTGTIVPVDGGFSAYSGV